MDATYFKKFCLLAYQDDFDGYTQLIRFTDGEHYEEIKEDLNNLIALGTKIESITTDGHKSVLKAIKHTLPSVKVQRCLVHIQRMCLLWLTRYKMYINEKTFMPDSKRYWFTHRLLRRTYHSINNALPNMFHYLDNEQIPKTTNGIEGYFSHLKNHLDLHRGLTMKNRINFIKWYVYFSNKK